MHDGVTAGLTKNGHDYIERKDFYMTKVTKSMEFAWKREEDGCRVVADTYLRQETAFAGWRGWGWWSGLSRRGFRLPIWGHLGFVYPYQWLQQPAHSSHFFLQRYCSLSHLKATFFPTFFAQILHQVSWEWKKSRKSFVDAFFLFNFVNLGNCVCWERY